MSKKYFQSQKQSRQDLKEWRNKCLDEWSFQSHQVPSWLIKKSANLLTLCKDQNVHGLMYKWLPFLDQLHQQLHSSDKSVSLDKAGMQYLDARLILNDTAVQAFSSKLATQDYMQHLQHLKPWRKGPWAFNGLHMQTEWDSSLKYSRLKKYGPDVQGKTILDVGSGNGYYGFRLLGDGARYVLGVDPSPLFWAQFMTFKHFNPAAPIDMLPIPGEPLESLQLEFDIVLSMGVLYHRRSAFEHLRLLKQCMANDGELVLETLVIDGDDQAFLMPQSTYAGMANVWGIPSVGLLKQWMTLCGFRDIECVSLAITDFREQQQTEWINTHSLENFLSPCGTKTKEGYPAPWRAMIRARK